jgi:hypothetical protein
MPAIAQRHGFLLKIGLTVGLVAAFDGVFPDYVEGAVLGGFALLWLVALVIANPATRRSRGALAALAGALLFVASLAIEPGPLAWALFWCALSMAALMPRTAGFDDAYRWGMRLFLHGVSGVVAPFHDLRVLFRRPRTGGMGARSIVAMLALPLAGTVIFTILFANANPVIASAIDHIEFPPAWRLLLWGLFAVWIWPSLRPRKLVTRLAARLPEPALNMPGTSLPSVLIALTLFNALFAIQNGLDVAFLWSGAALPPGMTAAEYAHRGAYPLIVTALLAGVLVIAMLRSGSATAANPLARRLVGVWVAQNVLLVASSALRTIDYVEVFMLTEWRIAALLWMALVATGLVLIFWRMWWGKSARWLINANALAAAVVLVPCCFVDLGATAATWNVRHAREVGGTGERIDLCYLRRLGPSALLALVELEHRPLDPVTLDRVRWVRQEQLDSLTRAQSGWSWAVRGAFRLERARALLGPTPPQAASVAKGGWRNCAGVVNAPPASAPPPPAAPMPAAPPGAAPDVAPAVPPPTLGLTQAPGQ